MYGSTASKSDLEESRESDLEDSCEAAVSIEQQVVTAAWCIQSALRTGNSCLLPLQPQPHKLWKGFLS